MALSNQQTAKLKELANASPLARAVFESMAKRDRPRNVTDVRRFRQALYHEFGVSVDTKEYDAIWTALQSLKLGKFFKSKDNTIPDRFKWEQNIIEVGVAATGLVKEKPSPSPQAQAIASIAGPSFPHFTVPVPLRGTTVSFALPSDFLTKDEHAAICTFLKNFVKG